MLVFAVVMTLSFGFNADSADAKRGGGFKSNKQSYTQKNDSATQSNSGSTSNTNKATTGTGTTSTTKSGGLFSGGSFLKGMAIGGLAGLLFGGMFSGMGAFGEILGFMINLLAIFAVIMVIRAAWTYVRNNKRPANATGYQNRNYQNNYDRYDNNNENDDRNQRG